MDVCVTVHACTAIHLFARIRALERRLISISLSRVATRTVAFLTELRRFTDKQCRVIASMRVVAVQTVLYNWLVLDPERSPLFSVAFEAEFIDIVSLHHLVAKPAVRLVAVSAFHFPFLDRVMRLPV